VLSLELNPDGMMTLDATPNYFADGIAPAYIYMSVRAGNPRTNPRNS
jgi:hypothetical protein